jgi:hypothetical protein
MIDYTRMKLGKKSRRYDHRTLRLGRYMTPALAPPPTSVLNSQSKPDWGMMLNDSLLDCTIAAVAHAVQVWTLLKGSEVTVPDPTILQYYEKWDGYDPKTPASDTGGAELDVLNCWRHQGFAGHRLRAFAAPDPQDTLHVRQAIALFGGLYAGLNMPASAQTQDVWDVDTSAKGHPGSWGGHCVFIPDYGAKGLTCITWGVLKKMTWGFFGTYCDEAHALLSPDFRPPAGFDFATLQADLAAVTA